MKSWPKNKMRGQQSELNLYLKNVVDQRKVRSISSDSCDWKFYLYVFPQIGPTDICACGTKEWLNWLIRLRLLFQYWLLIDLKSEKLPNQFGNALKIFPNCSWQTPIKMFGPGFGLIKQLTLNDPSLKCLLTIKAIKVRFDLRFFFTIFSSWGRGEASMVNQKIYENSYD